MTKRQSTNYMAVSFQLSAVSQGATELIADG